MLHDVLRAIANPIRVELLKALAGEGKRLSGLAQELGVGPEHLAYHLRLLRGAGLVTQVHDLYMLTQRGRKVLELLLELESWVRFEEEEPLVVSETGTLRPLRDYLSDEAANLLPPRGRVTKVRRAKIVVEVLNEVSHHGLLVPAHYASAALISRAYREGYCREGESSRDMGVWGDLSGSTGALKLLRESGLEDFALLRLVNFYISPNSGLLSLYIPSYDIDLLGRVVGGEAAPKEIIVRAGTEEESTGGAFIGKVLPFLRSTFVSIVTPPSLFANLFKREGEGAASALTLHSKLLLVLPIYRPDDIEGNLSYLLAKVLNRGGAVLFASQTTVPSSQLLTVDISDKVQAHLGACVISVHQVVQKARKLEKTPWEVLGKIFPRVADLFARLRKAASFSLSRMAEIPPEEVSFRAQVSLVGVEEGFSAWEGVGRDSDEYAYRLASWINELANFFREEAGKTVEDSDNLVVDLALFTPPVIAELSSFWKSSEKLNPLSPFNREAPFEELLFLESVLTRRLGKSLSVLELKSESISAVELAEKASAVLRSGVRLFTFTITGLKKCRVCGYLFGKAALRCPRCQSTLVGSLVREGLLYAAALSA